MQSAFLVMRLGPSHRVTIVDHTELTVLKIGGDISRIEVVNGSRAGRIWLVR